MATKVKLPSGAQRLIDVGGGHGVYAIEFCRQHPKLTATILDLPFVADIAREMIMHAEMTERVTFQPGNFFTDSLGEAYDVALLCNILHSHQPTENQTLLAG